MGRANHLKGLINHFGRWAADSLAGRRETVGTVIDLLLMVMIAQTASNLVFSLLFGALLSMTTPSRALCAPFGGSSVVAPGPAASSPVVTVPGSEVLSFQAWKQLRVNEARSVLEKLQAEFPPTTSTPSVVMKALPPGGVGRAALTRGPRAEQRLEQAKLNLEFAQDLTIHEYFVVYLSQFTPSRQLYLDVAKKMSTEETAEVLMALRSLQATGRSANLGALERAGLFPPPSPSPARTATVGP